MKKYIFPILMVALIPLTSHAEKPYIPTEPMYMPDNQAKPAITRYTNAFCQNGGDFKALENEVKNCYQTTPENSIEYQQCYLGDFFIMGVYGAPKIILGTTKKLTPDDSNFFNMNNYLKRSNDFKNLPLFNFIHNDKELAYYFIPTLDSLQKAIKNCNRNY